MHEFYSDDQDAEHVTVPRFAVMSETQGELSVDPEEARLRIYPDAPNVSNLEFTTPDDRKAGVPVAELDPDDLLNLIDQGLYIEEVLGEPEDDEIEWFDMIARNRMGIAHDLYEGPSPDNPLLKPVPQPSSSTEMVKYNPNDGLFWATIAAAGLLVAYDAVKRFKKD